MFIKNQTIHLQRATLSNFVATNPRLHINKWTKALLTIKYKGWRSKYFTAKTTTGHQHRRTERNKSKKGHAQQSESHPSTKLLLMAPQQRCSEVNIQSSVRGSEHIIKQRGNLALNVGPEGNVSKDPAKIYLERLQANSTACNWFLVQNVKLLSTDVCFWWSDATANATNFLHSEVAV